MTAMDKVSHQQDCDVYKNASKQLVLTYNDFAMECFRQRHFNEAILLLNKAIKEEKMEKGLYLNRGGKPTPDHLVTPQRSACSTKSFHL